MVVLRNRASSAFAGGPRQFAELRNKFIAKLSNEGLLSNVESELDRFGFDTKKLKNAPILVINAENNIDRVIEEIIFEEGDDGEMGRALEEVRDGAGVIDISRASIGATNRILNRLSELDGIENVEFAKTRASFGPENLRFDIGELADITPSAVESEGGTLEEVLEDLNIPDIWEVTKGENAIVCIFDTGFAELIEEERIVGTFHGDSVDSVFAPEEGHGTMCVGAAAANGEVDGIPFNGVAPQSDVILVRTTNDEGQIDDEIIADAWDWIASKDFDKPVITNHSYGVPLCSGRPKGRFCGDPLTDVIDIANEDPFLTSVYAAGNEAMRCGHRPSGITNAITGHNSLGSVIAVGALLTDQNDAQRYSSHGRGDCSPVADPKPNVSSAIPTKTYYGVEDGWKIKDLSTGPFGSGGGTSHASPMVCGMIALVQSMAMENDLPASASSVSSVSNRGDGQPLETEEVKQILKDNSEPPRRTQINQFSVVGPKGYDARFGFGQFRPDKAILGE